MLTIYTRYGNLVMPEFWVFLLGIPCFIALCRYCFILIFFVYNELKVCWQSCVEQVCWCPFPPAFAHFLFLMEILPIFQIFSLLCLSWWSVISDLWYCYHYAGWRPRWLLALFSNKIFFNWASQVAQWIMVCTLLFKHLIDYSLV